MSVHYKQLEEQFSLAGFEIRIKNKKQKEEAVDIIERYCNELMKKVYEHLIYMGEIRLKAKPKRKKRKGN